MALSVSQTVAVGKLVRGGFVASLGYPDVIAPIGLVKEVLGDRFGELTYRDDSAQICARHGFREVREIPDAVSFFSLLGAGLTVYDIVRERGCEVRCDLNYPMKVPQYDLVLDVGTAEHCFNIGQALQNMASMVKVGGHIVHENPFNRGNHGFYSLNPTLFEDFYSANGFEVKTCWIVKSDGSGVNPPRGKRFVFQDGEANVFVVAYRKEEKPFVYPVQKKYQSLIPPPG